MVKSKNPLYYAKILLFGEYGIIEDAMGLSIPFHDFTGEFKTMDAQPTEQQLFSNTSLYSYYQYLLAQQEAHALPCALNLQQMKSDLEHNIYFESSIPQGFGVGSSGAVVAAVYGRYAKQPITVQNATDADNLSKLKNTLGSLENYFHGRSSGLDPLICYLNLPVLIKSKQDMGTVQMPHSNAHGKGAIFLINSGNPGHTASMVTIFMQKLKNTGFRKLFKTELKKYNDACINDFLAGNLPDLFLNLKQLSSFFLSNFKQMIPQHFLQLWQQGLETNSYYLKLCGSGGGGYILGFTQDLEQAQKLLKDHKINVIHRF